MASQESVKLEKRIEVRWPLVFLAAIIFDGIKLLLLALDLIGLLGAGSAVNSILSSISGWIIWTLLKSGGAPNPWKDIQSSFISGIIPFWHYIGQSWIVRSARLLKKYKKMNAEFDKKRAEELNNLIAEINRESAEALSSPEPQIA